MGAVTELSARSMAHRTETRAGFHRCWYPVCRSNDLDAGRPVGRDILGTRVVVYRESSGKAVVQSAFCPHLGADLSGGEIVGDLLRCPYHHWSFGADGRCAQIASGDKIPPRAQIFTYPTAEAWGLVWMFNGESAEVEPPLLPDAEESDIVFAAHARGERCGHGWVAVSNGVDFQHLRTLHHLPAVAMPEQLEVDSGGITYRIESPFFLQHGRISGTTTFAQHLRIGGADSFMMFTSAPTEPGRSNGFYVVGVPKADAPRLAETKAMAERLIEEDRPVLEAIRFRRGLLTASDRHMARYFKYVEEFPCFLPPD
jgi:phenylpropionate dioxygenase-like ring-hydroxylating dioxygenase large terminal subunit